MGVEKNVADRANALSEAEQKRGRERKHHQKDEIHHPEGRKPKGINLMGGECREGMTPPPRPSSWWGVEKRKVVIISWC